jgi:RecB family endonuclease NucS
MDVRTLHRPSHRETLSELAAAFERGDVISVFGRCTVEYEGRAASTLRAGDRLLLLKPDGSALVHTDEKRTPVNWQPPGCEHRAAVRDGHLQIRSERTSPEESLTVRFLTVGQFSAYDATDEEELALTGSEEDLRQHVLENPELIEAGFEPLETERESAAGPMDIYGEDADGTPVVVELKRRRVGPDAVGQLQRYVKALSREFGEGTAIRGVLVAPSVTERAEELLAADGLEHVALTPEGRDNLSEDETEANAGGGDADTEQQRGRTELTEYGSQGDKTVKSDDN